MKDAAAYCAGQNGIGRFDYDEETGCATLISKFALDCQKYNTTFEAVEWKDNSLRKWLNDDFLKAVFSDEEQMAIVLTNVENGSDQGCADYTKIDETATEDKVYLLSY